MCTQQKIALWVCLISVILLTTFAQAQNYPNRPVTLVIPMFAGAAMDGAGRVLAEKLGEVLKTSVAVVNKPGASTVLGADFVVKSKNDGYTILLGNTSIVYAKVASPNIVPYDPFKDLEPLGLYCFFPFALAVRHDSPWKTFNDLVEYSKKNPKKIRISSPGELTLAHFNLEITQYVTGSQFTHIPHKGNQQLFLLGGNVEGCIDAATLITPHHKGNKLRALLVSKKMPNYPEIPTMSELGYKQELPSAWLAFFAPAGLTGEVRRILVTAIEKVASDPDTRSRIEKMEFIVDYKSPEEFKKLATKEYEAADAIAKRISLGK